jgi:RPA family protein
VLQKIRSYEMSDRVSVTIRPQLRSWLQQYAAHNRWTISAAAQYLIELGAKTAADDITQQQSAAVDRYGNAI